MKLHASPREIRNGYNLIKRMAKESFEQGDLSETLKYVNHCAILAQQFNWIYADDELEYLLASVGERIIPERITDYEPVEERVVFYDDFCTSFVLALQYLRALVAAKKEILYITSRNINATSKFATIIDEVSSYPNVTVTIIPQKGRQARIRDIYSSIVSFRPKTVLLHMVANSVAIPALYHLPEGIDRYLINLADQTFWLGKKAIDYSLEFRPFGASVSLQRRGLTADQLLMVPFYPIADNNPFEGFPEVCTSDKVIIFSGGDLYKVVDRKKTYWKLVKQILDCYPQVIFLFATKVTFMGAKMIKRFIEENGFQGRFIHIGFRKDINEVFKHCDIYMGTCPASGSLMSQLAAINAKPILQFYFPGTPDDETEQAICINESFQISFRDTDALMKEAEMLITDVDYRSKQGERLRSAIMQPEQFNNLVMHILEGKRTEVPVTSSSIDYALLCRRWFELEKGHITNTLPYISGIVGKKKAFLFAPSIFVKTKISKLLKK